MQKNRENLEILCRENFRLYKVNSINFWTSSVYKIFNVKVEWSEVGVHQFHLISFPWLLLILENEVVKIAWIYSWYDNK